MRHRSDYKSRAIKFLRMVYPYIQNCLTDPDECMEQIEVFNQEKSRHARMDFGASRIAIIASDYVIKFDYDKENVRDVGGCETELMFYSFAKRKGYERLFAEISCVVYKNTPFFIMPRIPRVGDGHDMVEMYLSEEDSDFVSEYLFDMHENNYGFINHYPVIVDYASNVLLEGVDLGVTTTR